MSETSQVATSGSTKRVHRTPAEKRRIVEATLVLGVSIARVARENGVNANQVFQWRYEHKNSVGWAANQSRTKLLPVAVVPEPSCIIVPEVAPTPPPPPPIPSSASIHIELPGRALVSVEAGVDPELVRTVLGSLLR